MRDEPEHRRLYLAGSGSFAAEVGEWAQAAGWEVVGLVELVDRSRVGTAIDGRPVLAPDARQAGSSRAVVAAGGDRRERWRPLAQSGWRAATVVHPGACVSPSARLGEGCVVGPGAVVGAHTAIGAHALVSRGALVGHHVSVGEFASLLPGANVASHVTIGDGATLGMASVVVDHTGVGAGATVAAGAVVIGEVVTGTRVQGVPARLFRR